MKPSAMLALTLALSIPLACTIDAPSARIGADAPDRSTFTAPATILISRCGSLDCHGDMYRNYRLYGYGGARLASSDRPNDSQPEMTTAELNANYDATVSVEPERTRDIASGKAKPGSSTLIRKARGAEKHVGGKRIDPGSDEDRCLVGWLTNTPDDAACTAATGAP